MRRLAVASISTLVAALVLAMPSSACTSDCNLPDVELTEASGCFDSPQAGEITSEMRGVNVFQTETGKSWQWGGEITAELVSSLEVIIHSNSGLITAREWGTLSVSALFDDEMDPEEDTILLRTIAKGYLEEGEIDVHFEIVGGTGYFEGAVGYGDAVLHLFENCGEYTLYFGFE